MKLTVALYNFANAPKTEKICNDLHVITMFLRQIIHLKKAMYRGTLFRFNAAFIGNV